MEQQHAEAVDVQSDRRLAAAQQLGREVQRRARQPATRRGAGRVHVLPRPEVHQHEAPALLAHDVLRLDVAMHEPGLVDRRQRTAQFLANERGFARAERPRRAQQLLEGPATDVLHPEANPPLLLLHAEDRDDVAVADPGEDAAFVKDLLGELGRLAPLAEQLEGHVAVESRVARPVDVAERALTNLLDEFEVPPVVQRAGRRRGKDTLFHRGGIGVGERRADPADDAPAPGRRGRRPGRILGAVQLRDVGQHPQVLQQLPVLVVDDGGFEVLPVDIDGAVGDRGGEFEESGALRAHGTGRPASPDRLVVRNVAGGRIEPGDPRSFKNGLDFDG